MKEKKYYIYLPIIAVVVIVAAGLLLYRFVFTKNSSSLGSQDVNYSKALTTEEKQKILEGLSSTTSDMKPLPIQEKSKILKQVQASTTSKPLTDEEKLKILENLGK